MRKIAAKLTAVSAAEVVQRLQSGKHLMCKSEPVYGSVGVHLHNAIEGMVWYLEMREQFDGRAKKVERFAFIHVLLDFQSQNIDMPFFGSKYAVAHDEKTTNLEWQKWPGNAK